MPRLTRILMVSSQSHPPELRDVTRRMQFARKSWLIQLSDAYIG
jgi:hypothetical protein